MDVHGTDGGIGADFGSAAVACRHTSWLTAIPGEDALKAESMDDQTR